MDLRTPLTRGRPPSRAPSAREGRAVAEANKDNIEESDDALAAKLRGGDATAYRRLVERHLPSVFALAKRMLGSEADAEDAVQEVFLKLWRKKNGWRPGQAKFSTWLYRVAMNVCLDHLRQRKRKAYGKTDALDPALPDTGVLPDEQAETKQTEAAVNRALQSLPERQRAAIHLFHMDGMSLAEGAAVLNTSVDAYESLLRRARIALRKQLSDEETI